MKVRSIELKDYRNYPVARFEFRDGVNIIQGANAQGKTNLLEAIYYCSIGKSLRVSREKEVIRFGCDKAKILLQLERKYKKTQIMLLFSRTEKKTIKLDNIPIKRIGELMGEFYAVYFSPDEMKLIKESPEDRRRFMDIHISQTSKQYFYFLGRYEKILANRNKLLKTQTDVNIIKDTIDIWDRQLIEVGTKIIHMRNVFVDNLAPYVQKCHAYLTQDNEELMIEYTGVKSHDLNEIRDSFEKKIKQSFDKDIKLGYTTIGPHRDDIKVVLNGVDIRLYGSQGQQRTAALSLKLAELEIMYQETGEMPVLLLDDVLSELDQNRRERLLKFCTKAQTFITGTDFPQNPAYTYYNIFGGTR